MKRYGRSNLPLILDPRGREAGIVNRLDVRDRRLALDRLGRLAIIGLWVATACIVAANLDQGWVPHDDGAFAQSAERVLAGDLPHREFAELYTGGMTFLNAGVMALLGTDLIWLRLPLFVLFLAFIPCVYFVARRFVRPVIAAVVALLAVSWSVPIYPAAVPSWYQLYFAVFGITALMRHLDTGRIRWLVTAGVFGGLSISFKIVGVWYVLAVLLYFVFVEQDERALGVQKRKGPSIYGALVVGFAGFSVATVGALLSAHLGSAEVVNFLLPIALLCGLICAREWQVAGSASLRQRVHAYSGLACPFLVGVAVPLIAVVLPYVVTGSLGDLMRGLFVSPQSRLDYAYLSTPSALNLFWAVPALMTLVGRRWLAPVWRRSMDTVLVTVLITALVTGQHEVSYALLWRSARELAPVIVVAGCALLFLASRRGGRHSDQRLLVLLLLVASLVSLLQFPFGAPIYFVYSAPLFALAGAAVVQQARAGGGWVPVTLLVVYMLFGFTWLDRASIHTLGLAFQPTRETVILDRDIARIRVTPEHATTYRKAALLLERHATGRFVFAGPDAPELYYLSRHENPTRSLFDFLDTSNSARGHKLVRVLRARAVTAIAINLHPDLSDPLDPKTLGALVQLYPQHARAGKFDVRWK